MDASPANDNNTHNASSTNAIPHTTSTGTPQNASTAATLSMANASSITANLNELSLNVTTNTQVPINPLYTTTAAHLNANNQTVQVVSEHDLATMPVDNTENAYNPLCLHGNTNQGWIGYNVALSNGVTHIQPSNDKDMITSYIS